jgi:ADP-heptose:LPS heptosyltransferase
VWERLVLRWQGVPSSKAEPVDIFRALREARQILVVPNDRVGGLFIGAPVYKVIRQFYPQAHIRLLVDVAKAEIARHLPFVDQVLTADLSKPVWSSAFKEVQQQLRRQSLDLAFCLGSDCSFRLAHLCRTCGARLRVGFHRRGLEPFNVEVVPARNGRYEVAQCFAMLRLFGLEGEEELRWTLVRDKAEQIRARYLDSEENRLQIVGINLAGGEGRGLSTRQLDDIVGRVVERGARALLFFSLAENKQVNYLKETYGNRAVLFEQEDLPTAAALLEGCKALISCNADLLHLAIALQVPVVGIFDEEPERWVPPDNKLIKVVRVQNLRTVSIAQIVQALEAALREERRLGSSLKSR